MKQTKAEQKKQRLTVRQFCSSFCKLLKFTIKQDLGTQEQKVQTREALQLRVNIIMLFAGAIHVL